MRKQVSDEFTAWLEVEMKKRNWGVRETARNVGVSHPTISEIFTLGRLPSLETCKALAKALGVPVVSLLYLSGQLEPPPDWSPALDELTQLFTQLEQRDQEELIEIARLKAARGKK